MVNLSRRDFLSFCAKITALIGLESTFVPQIAEGVSKLINNAPPVIWLQGQSCSGCSVSLLNSYAPGPAELITRYISLKFHSTLSTATGDVAMDTLNQVIKDGGYFLVFEGSVPSKMPEACLMGHVPVSEILSDAAKNSEGIIAVGTCASFGGIPAAENNPTGAISVPLFLKNENINKPTILLPGCPAHPDWIVGTLVHMIKFGLPPLDAKGRPKMFFAKLIHEQCPRFSDYEREKFAKTFTDKGCLFRLGCIGPNTYADCTIRYWNSRINSCIPSGAPCIGCASEDFAIKANFPFFRKGEEKKI
ncbi:MAG: hydrogenase small subunit [Desulfobacterales bacterium]|nr:hydrogenase small subunit [Desulfobacterales bacterium]MBF0397004.1 hydrogenase small subunit [Desulfobacterales bacterium]